MKITLIKGDGIGPEVSGSAKAIIDAALALHSDLKIDWEIFDIVEGQLSDALFKSLETNKVAIKGPITTPIGFGFKSINVFLRQKYNLYANVRPIKKIIPTRYEEPIDLVIFRENTEGLYAGIEHVISEDHIVAEKVTTRGASIKIAKAAFEHALKLNASKVTVVHKANILKQCDGLFLETVRSVAKDYPNVELSEMIVDNTAMQMVMKPSQFGIMVTTNLYGDILSDLAAGLIGGLGLAPSANIGEDMAIFEPVHGSAPDIAGQNIANPTACILSGILMLEHLGEMKAADAITKAITAVLEHADTRTKDLGGTLTTSEFTDAVINKL